MIRKINEHGLRCVVDFFVKGYKIKRGEKLHSYDWYLDPVKGKVFIITYIESSKDITNISEGKI